MSYQNIGFCAFPSLIIHAHLQTVKQYYYITKKVTYLKSSSNLLLPDGFESKVIEEPPKEDALPRTPPILLNKELELFGFAVVLNMAPLAARPLMAKSNTQYKNYQYINVHNNRTW